MNKNKKTKNKKMNKAISNMGNSNSVDALNASTNNTPAPLNSIFNPRTFI